MITEDLITVYTSEEDLLKEIPEGYCYGGNISANGLSNRELCAEFCLIVKKSDGVFGPVDVEVIYRLQVPPEEAPAPDPHEQFVARLARILQASGTDSELLELVADLVAERDNRLVYMSQKDELT